MNLFLKLFCIFCLFCFFLTISNITPAFSGDVKTDKIQSDSGWIDAGKYKWVQADKPDSLIGVYFSKLEKKIYTFNGRSIKVWDFEKGTLIKETGISGGYQHFAVSPDEKTIYLSVYTQAFFFDIGKDTIIKTIILKLPNIDWGGAIGSGSHIFCSTDGNHVILFSNLMINYSYGKYIVNSGMFGIIDKEGNLVNQSGIEVGHSESIVISPDNNYFSFSASYTCDKQENYPPLQNHFERNLVNMNGDRTLIDLDKFNQSFFSKDSKFLIGTKIFPNIFSENDSGEVYFYDINKKQITDSSNNFDMLSDILPFNYKNKLSLIILSRGNADVSYPDALGIYDKNNKLLVDSLRIEQPLYHVGDTQGGNNMQRLDNDIFSISPDSETVALIARDGKLIIWKSPIIESQLLSYIIPDKPIGIENISNSFKAFIYKGNPTSYLWDFGDGTTSTEQNPQHIYEKKGNYRIRLITYDKINYDTCFYDYKVEQDFNAHFTITISKANFPYNVLFVPDYDNSGEYDWTIEKINESSSNQIFSSNKYLNYTFNEYGKYKISLKINYGGYLRQWDTVIVLTSISSTNEEMNNSTEFICVYSSNTLTLNYTLPSSQPVNIQVSGILGNVIYEKQMEGREGSNRTEIDMTPFTNGIYFIRMRQGDKVINTKFFKD